MFVLRYNKKIIMGILLLSMLLGGCATTVSEAAKGCRYRLKSYEAFDQWSVKFSCYNRPK